MRRILVTGGNGFIGSHTSINLLQKGYDVLILDSLVNSSKGFYEKIKNLANKIDSKSLSRISFVEGDIRNSKLLDEIFKKSIIDNKRIEGVIHFAGLKAVGESSKDPFKYWDFNFIGTFRLIEVMEKYKCRTLIFSSSVRKRSMFLFYYAPSQKCPSVWISWQRPFVCSLLQNP